MLKSIFEENKFLVHLGSSFLLLSVVLAVLIPFNSTQVLGINALVKPLKFAISIWIYCWTMAWLLIYFKNETVKKKLIILIAVTLVFEQAVITIQAFRGTLSHFNVDTIIELLLFLLMGVMIVWFTCYNLYLAILFQRQKDDLPRTKKQSIVWGLVIFVIASFMGGVMAGMRTHTLGGEMGGPSIPFLNWSTTHGDLRVAHFIGLHALQVIPAIGFGSFHYFKNKKMAYNMTLSFSIFYLVFILFAFFQAIMGLPFLAL